MYVTFHAYQMQTNLDPIKSVHCSITSEGHDTDVIQEKWCTQPAVSFTNTGSPTTLEQKNSIRMLYLPPLGHTDPPETEFVYVSWQ